MKEKIILGTSDAWSMSRLSQRPSILYWSLSDFCSLFKWYKRSGINSTYFPTLLKSTITKNTAHYLPTITISVACCLVEDWFWTKLRIICIITDGTFAELGAIFFSIHLWPCKFLADAIYVPLGYCIVGQIFFQVSKYVFHSLALLFPIFEQYFNWLQ